MRLRELVARATARAQTLRQLDAAWQTVRKTEAQFYRSSFKFWVMGGVRSISRIQKWKYKVEREYLCGTQKKVEQCECRRMLVLAVCHVSIDLHLIELHT